jgi:hypothetical protein
MNNVATTTTKYCKNCKYESMLMCYHPINGQSEVSGYNHSMNCFRARRGACYGGVLYEPSKLTKVLMFFRLI